MRIFAAAAAFSAAALLAAGCRAGAACPAIAQASVVLLTVAREYAGVVDTIHLKACQDGRCMEADLQLFPGSTVVDEGCGPGTLDGHDTCSATSVPDGTLTGTLMLDVLTGSGMEVTLTGTDTGGLPLPVRTLSFMPPVAYPFGKECGSFISAIVVLDSAGLRQGGQAQQEKPLR